jgi:hypothetical protein
VSKNLRHIEGKLLRPDGETLDVPLAVITVELRGQHGVEAEAVSEVRLASRNVPDGDYTLEYFCFEPHRSPIKVQHGVLVRR